MKLKRRAVQAAESTDLFQVVAVRIGIQPEFYAKSLVNEWRGINRSREAEAKADGEKHAEALKFLFSGRVK